MPLIYDKPFKDYKEQLNLLQEQYSLGINKNEFELEMLSSISYYDLINGYKECFMENDKFKLGITQDYIFQFLIFDKNFQNILFKYSVYAENTFKTKLAYIIGKNISVDDKIYLDKKKYSKNSKNIYKKRQLSNLIESLKYTLLNTTDNPTKHYRATHNHIPTWIFFKNISFNNSIDLYSFLEHNSKIEFISEYFNFADLTNEEKANTLKNMITIIRKFRNKIAHNSKVITYKVPEKYELQRQILLKIFPKNLYTTTDVKRKIGDKDLFAMILSLIHLLGNNYLVSSMLQEIHFLLDSNLELGNEYIKLTNLPIDLIERLKNIRETYSEKSKKSYQTKI